MVKLGEDTIEKGQTSGQQVQELRHRDGTREPRPYETPPDYKAPTMSEQWKYVRFWAVQFFLAQRASSCYGSSLLRFNHTLVYTLYSSTSRMRLVRRQTRDIHMQDLV